MNDLQKDAQLDHIINSSAKEIEKHMWNILSIKDSFEEYNNERYLYHYTSAEGLYGMIDNGVIWATRRDFMNDMVEIEDAEKFLPLLEKLYKDKKEPYLFCLSKEGDMSNQWAHYGQSGGYCITFDNKKLYELTKRAVNKHYVFEVIYSDEEKKELASLINNDFEGFVKIMEDTVIKYVETTRSKNSKNESPSYRTLSKKYNDGKLATVMFLYRLYTVFKGENNKYEQEVRYIIENYNDTESQTRIINGVFTPYKEIRVPQNDNGKRILPIKEITIGPNVHDPMAIEGLSLYLKSKGYKTTSDENNNDENIILIKKSKSKVRR